MDDNLKFITEFVASHRDELVLDCFDVVMLKDFADGDDDYYYVVIGERGTYWTSCVGPLYPLKNVLPEDEYNGGIVTVPLPLIDEGAERSVQLMPVES